MNRIALCALSMIVSCKSEAPQPAPVAVEPPAPNPAGSARANVADDIAKTVDELASTPPEAIPAAAAQAAVDPAALLGTWQIKHLIYIKDNKPGPPESPIVEGSWTFEKGGRFLKHGGNELEGTFVLTKNQLVISALGPALEYSVDKLTKSDLVVTQLIMPGMGTTTVLKRK